MLLRALALLLLVVPLSLGQTPKTPAPKTPAGKNPKKDNSPPGYKKSDLRGFTLFFSDEVMGENDKSKLKRTPLEALERELIIVESVIPPDKLKAIKAVPIWVEWNESVAMGNGRGGSAVAVFSGGFQQDVFAEAGKAVKGNSVTILKLRSLALEHQPVTDSGRCVTLHELAHAFQFFNVGDDNIIVKNTYKQAMERKLYDPALYVATNEHEYFAELTCAYLDRMDAFPRTRDELKKHDPKGFEMMEKFWGKVVEKKDATAKGPRLPSKDGDGIPATLAKLNAISENIGSDAKPDWTLLRDTLIEGAKRRLGEAESMMKDDPVGAWVILEKIVAGYKSTPVAKSANEMILKLKSNPKVALEVRARTALEPIRKLDTQLAGRDLSFDPRNPRFQQENAGTLKQLEDAIARLRKSFPESLATTEGQRIADHWLGKR